MDANKAAEQEQRDPRRAQHITGAVLVMLAGLFLTVSWGLPHMWVLLAGLLLAALAFLAVREIKLPVKLLIFAASGILVALFAVASILFEVKDSSGSEETEQSAHTIQLAIERYATDAGGVYPVTLEPVQQEGYLPAFPRNWFNLMPNAALREQLTDEQLDILSRMQPLGANRLPDELQERLEWPGNFCYLPRIEPDGAGGYTASGYSLLVFGKKRWNPGMWDDARTMPIVVYYYNSETGVEQTWR